jgi:hypothetical protein
MTVESWVESVWSYGWSLSLHTSLEDSTDSTRVSPRRSGFHPIKGSGTTPCSIGKYTLSLTRRTM